MALPSGKLCTFLSFSWRIAEHSAAYSGATAVTNGWKNFMLTGRYTVAYGYRKPAGQAGALAADASLTFAGTYVLKQRLNDYDGDGLNDQIVFDNATGACYIFSVDGALIAWARAWGWSCCAVVGERQ